MLLSSVSSDLNNDAYVFSRELIIMSNYYVLIYKNKHPYTKK